MAHDGSSRALFDPFGLPLFLGGGSALPRGLGERRLLKLVVAREVEGPGDGERLGLVLLELAREDERPGDGERLGVVLLE